MIGFRRHCTMLTLQVKETSPCLGPVRTQGVFD